MGIRGFAPLI